MAAKRHFQSAVALTGTGLTDSGLQPLAAWAEYLAQVGERAQAIVTAAFILQEPSFTQEDRDVAARILNRLAATVPAQDLAALRTLGERATWDEIIGTALAEFAG